MTNKLICLLLFVMTPIFAADFNIVVRDAAGEGFNSTEAVSPEGGNDATTLGEQRLNVLRRAMEIWGENLVSAIPIEVEASMEDLVCDTETGSAALASANANYASRNFTGAPQQDVYYHAALANALHGDDTDSFESDITVRININIDEDSGCRGLFGGWYYGYDHNNGNRRDLLATILHELGHGLGIQSLADPGGRLFNDTPDTYTLNIYDLEVDMGWGEMTNAERATSGINDPNVVWTGPKVTAEAPNYLLPNRALLMNIASPESIAGRYQAVQAAFGGTISSAIDAELVAASPLDACTPITNDVNGKVVLIDRGSCEFGAKVLAAEEAGALAVVMVNNTSADPIFAMGAGAVGNQVTIPSVMISLADGGLIRDALPANITLSLDPGLAGANEGFVRLHAPSPYDRGSSISHFTEDCDPELLMEPVASDTLSDLDLSVAMLADMGWPTTTVAADTYTLLYPWLSHNENFESVLVINNVGLENANVTLRARRDSGDPIEVTATVPAFGFLEETATQLFPTLADGGGFTVEVTSTSPDLQGRWVTFSLQAASGASPSQGVAIPLGQTGKNKKQLGNALLYGYLPNTDGIVSAPVVVNAGTVDTAVTLYFYDKNGTLLKQDDTSIPALSSYRPFAAPMDTLLPGDKQNVMMIAYSPTQQIAGAVFVFDLSTLEPAIGTAQAISFTPPAN